MIKPKIGRCFYSMDNTITDIGKKDVFWTFAASFFKIGAGVLLFPFILGKLPAETVGIWTIFSTITLLSTLFDFGFNQSFARNITYVFSGVRELKKKGYETVGEGDREVDFNLLKSTISAMRYFYLRVALLLFFLLLTVGSVYISFLVSNYSGNKSEIYISWVILCSINCYILYTLYYESLLMGRGLVKRVNQIILVGNVAYLLLAILLLECSLGLVAVVSSQAASVVIMRVLSYKSFYTKDLKRQLAAADDSKSREVLRAITPNAVKLGLTALGGFLINRASLFIGSLYVPLEDTASFGITLQLLLVLAQTGSVLSRVFMPKVYQWRVEGKLSSIRRMFYITSGFLLAVFVVGGAVIVFIGNWALDLVNSNTPLLATGMLSVMLLQRYLETNHVNAADFLLSKNEVPFFRASLISAAATLVLLFIFVGQMNMGVWGMILAPTIVQLAYQNWRWPYLVVHELSSK